MKCGFHKTLMIFYKYVRARCASFMELVETMPSTVPTPTSTIFPQGQSAI